MSCIPLAYLAHGIGKSFLNGPHKLVRHFLEERQCWNTTMRDFLNKRGQMTCWFAVASAEPDAAMRERMRDKMRLFDSVGRY